MGIIVLLIWYGKMYFDWQQTNALNNRGVTVYANVDSVYTSDRLRNQLQYFAITEYNLKGTIYHKTFQISRGQYNPNDTLILKIATDKGNPIYYKVVGIRSNGADLFKN